MRTTHFQQNNKHQPHQSNTQSIQQSSFFFIYFQPPFAFTSTNFHLITINYHNYSTIKTTTFDLWLFQQFKFNRFIVLNQYNRHFFFSKIFNSNLKLISTKNNQLIDQSTNTILKYLSLKKRSKCSNSIHPKFPHSSHTNSYLLWPITSIQSPKKSLCFSTTHCNFASQQIHSHFTIHFPPKPKPTTSHNPFIFSVLGISITALLLVCTLFHIPPNLIKQPTPSQPQKCFVFFVYNSI